MSRATRALLAAGLWLAAPGAWARSPAPAEAAATAEPAAGTTVVGDRDAPTGLYIAPWKNSAADASLDRPPLVLDERPAPLDGAVLRRQVQDYAAVTAHQRGETLQNP